LEKNNNNGINQPVVAPKRSSTGKLWVPVVLLVGLVVGVLLADLSTQPTQERAPFFRQFPPVFNPDPTIRLHVILTTVEVTLLIALVVVYLRVYNETRANFALGLVIVLGALFLQTVFSYPLVVGLQGPVLFVRGSLPTLSDVLEICAYTVFLYLSLE
jgi:hypothetical protein